jgi:hypothetical protein
MPRCRAFAEHLLKPVQPNQKYGLKYVPTAILFIPAHSEQLTQAAELNDSVKNTV